MELGLKKNRSEIWLLAMFPIYFGLQGLHKTTEPFSGGFIVPVSFFLGLAAFVIITLNLSNRPLYIPGHISLILYYYAGCSLFCLLGIIVTGGFGSIVPYFQFLSGLMGVALAYWCFVIKKIDFARAAWIVSILYLILICLNLLDAAMTTGLERFQNRWVNTPGTPWWSILQPWVYYPYIVTAVFMFALPAWRKKCNKVVFYMLYIAVFCYVFLFNVRGAILTFVVCFGGYILFFLKNKKEKYIVLLCAMLCGAALFMSNTVQNMLAGMFSSVFFETMGGRDYLYAGFFNNIVSDPFYLLSGSLFKSRILSGENVDIFTQGIASYHNFYLELVDLGGIPILLGFAYCVVKLLKVVLKGRRVDTRFSYWLFIIIMQLIIDMNINVPLRNTNPAIVYWFFWVGCAVYAINLKTVRACTTFKA